MAQYSNFGVRARAIMLKRKITATTLAKELNISNSYLGEILKGTRRGKKYKPKIMEILGMEESPHASANRNKENPQ